MKLFEWFLVGVTVGALILCFGTIGFSLINDITANIQYETISENLSYLSDETVIELYGDFLSGTSGGEYLRIRYAVITPEGIQIHSERLENNKIFIQEENTTNPRREAYIQRKVSKIIDDMNCGQSDIKITYIVPNGTIKRNFEIDYR